MISKPFLAALLLAALFAPGSGPLLAGGSPRNIVAAARTTPVTVDGVLSEPVWESAVQVGGFLQYDPAEGSPATERTTVRALFDDDNIYFGIFCHDSDPSLIDRQLTRRDRTAQSDRVSVIIDSYHGHETAFLFGVTASGVQSDGVFSYDGILYDVQWDAVWEVGTAVTPGGWGAEFKIPFSALRFSLQDSEYVWGVNFRRYIARKNETDEWVMVPRNETQPGVLSSISRMGHLSGMTKISPAMHIEILPYQVTTFGHFAQPPPFDARQELTGALGLDAKYGVSNNVTLDLAVNPDFGQVEVDQAVLNLTVFDTYYPEKRPFFLEGSSFFTFGNAFDNRDLRLFYSRRIGREPTYPRVPPKLDTSPRTGMTNYPRDEFDRVPEFSNRSGSHRANGWAAAASAGGVRPGLRWLMVFGAVALLVGVFSFTALPKLLNDGGGKAPANVAASSSESSADKSAFEGFGEGIRELEGFGQALKSAEPSETDAVPSESESGLGGVADLSMKVGVYNGAKKVGLAGTVRTTLLNAGFTNVSAANWSKQVTYSTVYYRDEASRATAEQAAEELGISSVVKTTNIPGSIAVVLGNTFR